MGALDHLKDELADARRARTAAASADARGRAAGARARFDGRDVINLASNNYLGLAAPPAAEAGRVEGGAASSAPGRGAVRTIAGTMTLHRELERRFADFKHAEAALMFQSGFTANAGTVAAILTKEDVIVSDQLNHASIIDGARLSRAEIKVFPHKDVEAADALLAETARRRDARQLLITDGVFSMDGDIAPLPGPGRGRRAARRDHDDRRRARVRRAGDRRRGHGRPLRSARPGRHPGRDAVEGDRRARRVHRRAASPDRVAGEPGPAVPVLHVAPRRPWPRRASRRST